MPETIFELKDKLTRATDPEGNVLDTVAVNHVIVSLEGMTITPEDLQATRIGKQVNDIRKNTKDNKLAKRIRKLVKKWQNLLNLKQPNGTTIPVENGVDKRPGLVTTSVLPNTNNSSSSFSGSVNSKKSLKLKEQLTGSSLYHPTITSSTVTNSAPHPINASTHLQLHHTNSMLVTFVHPPPEPMPSSLIVSIARRSVKLKSDNVSIPSLSVSSENTDGFSLVSPPAEFGGTPDMFGSVDPYIMDMLSTYDSSKTFEDDLLDISKSQTSTGRITPAEETIQANNYLLDMSYDNLTSLKKKDSQLFHVDSVDGKGKIEGVDGYFSNEGAWCDWTQPIPPKSDDSVVVLPYVYID